MATPTYSREEVLKMLNELEIKKEKEFNAYLDGLINEIKMLREKLKDAVI